jgi:outer membrane protein TolC
MNLSMTLYDFGQREFRLETAELSLVSAGHAFNSTLQGAIANALRAYYNLLTAQNAVGVAAKSERFARESYEAAKLRHEIGQVPLADELQAKGSYSQAQLSVQQTENNLLQQQAAIAILMGMKPDTKVVVEEVKEKFLAKDPFVAELKTLMEVAKEKRQDLQARRASLRGAEISLEAQKRANLATLSVTTNMGVSNDTAHLFNNKKSRSQAVGFTVSIPIFSGFNRLYSQQASETSLEAQRESLVGTELSIVQDVWNSWHNYETAKRSWRTSKEQLANAINLKDVALARYREGLGTILDVLNAQLQYTSALQSTLQSRYNLLTSRVDVVRAVGTLDMDTMQPETTTNLNPRAELSQER